MPRASRATDTVRTATANGHKPAGGWAAAVSRTLREGGLSVTMSGSRSRQGLRVKSSEVGRCRVVADFDTPSDGEQAVEAAAGILGRAGYTVERNDSPPIYGLTVTRPEPPATDRPTVEWKRRPRNVLGEVTYEHRWFPGWVVTAVDDGFSVKAPRRSTTVPAKPFETVKAATDWIEANQ